jgi:hypothetical protein
MAGFVSLMTPPKVTSGIQQIADSETEARDMNSRLGYDLSPRRVARAGVPVLALTVLEFPRTIGSVAFPALVADWK